MLKNFITKEIKESLSHEKFSALIELIKNENSDSILASLNKNLIIKYIEICIKSENLFLYSNEFSGKIIGYALLAKKPVFLIDEFKSIKYSILFNLLSHFKLKVILNIFLSLSKIDLMLISKKKKFIIKNSFNLNLLAINKNFQSKGIGKSFLENIFNDIKKKEDFKIITVETFNSRAASYYKNKVNFNYVGIKFRFLKNLKIYKKEDFQ